VARVLWVAAMRGEALALAGALRQPRLRAGVVEGALGPHTVGLVRLGVGPRRARAGTTEAIARWAPELVINLGTCGALVDDLEEGEVLHGAALLGRSGRRELRTLGGRTAAIVTVSQPVFQRAERARLAAMGAQACEMEADAVRAACEERGLPLFVVKVVSDQAGAEADAALPSGEGRLPILLATARFSARAFRLVRRHLAPKLPRWMDEAAALTSLIGPPLPLPEAEHDPRSSP
jgi:adenosylhomocysteine nucleosidase